MMSGQMIYTNKFLCISFAANSEIFSSFFFFFQTGSLLSSLSFKFIS